MFYKSSKGEVEIATMPHKYASNALAKLIHDEPARKAEIEALEAHVAAFDQDGEPANPRVAIGDNHPPEEVTESVTPTWATVKIHMDDLLTEATNWADGVAIVNQAQADKVGTLRQLLQDAATLADTARVAEKKPLDEQIEKIQSRYNEYIAPMKNKVPGKVPKSVTALGNLLTAWLVKVAAEKKAREDKAQAIADAAAAAAIEARQAIDTTTDLAVIEEAEALLDLADNAARALRNVSAEKVQAKGEFRAIGLRSTWEAVVTDKKAAILHYMKEQPEEFVALVQRLADKAAKNEATRRPIPGVTFKENQHV